MKKTITLISILLLFFTFACSNDGGGSDSVNEPIITGPDTPPEVAPPVNPGEYGPVIASMVTSDGIKFYDGEQVWLWKSGKKARSHVYSSGNVLYSLNDYGFTYESKNLVTDPDQVKIILESEMSAMATEIPIGQSDVWIVDIIPWEDAVSMGMPAVPNTDYTRIYENSVEYGNWMLRDYPVDNIIILNDDIFAKKSNGAWISVNDTKNDVQHVEENGFVLWDYDHINRTAMINDIAVSWDYNFLNNAKMWLKSGTKWYSVNGYTWDGSTLVENGSKMWDFRTESNIVITVGTHYENGEDVLYFLNCATGYVIRYVPSVDQYIEFVRLYTGDGTDETGTTLKQTLNPNIVGDDLFYIYDANTFHYNFTTGLNSLFGSGISEVMEY